MRPPFEREDGKVQHSLLVHVLAEHPVQLSEAELMRELAADPEAFGPRDQVQRAIGDLVRVGLLHRHGQLVLPTRAALYFGRLWDEFQ